MFWLNIFYVLLISNIKDRRCGIYHLLPWCQTINYYLNDIMDRIWYDTLKSNVFIGTCNINRFLWYKMQNSIFKICKAVKRKGYKLQTAVRRSDRFTWLPFNNSYTYTNPLYKHITYIHRNNIELFCNNNKVRRCLFLHIITVMKQHKKNKMKLNFYFRWIGRTLMPS